MKRKVIAIAMAGLLLVTVGVFAAGQGEAADGPVTGFSIASSSVGSSSYSKLTIWGGHIGQKLDIDIIPEGTAGAAANITLTQAGETEMGSTMTNLAREAFEGTNQFEGQEADRIRAVLTLDGFALQFYGPARSGIRSIYDLEGKHVNLSRAGSGTDTWARRVFDVLGINPGRISNVGPGEANDLLRDGGLDVSAVMGSAHPSIIELNATHDIVVFGTGDGTDAFIQEWPGMEKLVMRNIYEGVPGEFVTIGEMNLLIADKDFDEDVVYQIVKLTYEEKDVMASGYQGFATINPEDIHQNLIPLHRGAYRYFQEIGLDIPSAIMPID